MYIYIYNNKAIIYIYIYKQYNNKAIIYLTWLNISCRSSWTTIPTVCPLFSLLPGTRLLQWTFKRSEWSERNKQLQTTPHTWVEEAISRFVILNFSHTLSAKSWYDCFMPPWGWETEGLPNLVGADNHPSYSFLSAKAVLFQNWSGWVRLCGIGCCSLGHLLKYLHECQMNEVNEWFFYTSCAIPPLPPNESWRCSGLNPTHEPHSMFCDQNVIQSNSKNKNFSPDHDVDKELFILWTRPTLGFGWTDCFCCSISSMANNVVLVWHRWLQT